MCFDLDSSPPVPTLRGAAVDHEELVIESTDGNRFAAFAALPEERTEKGIVVLPDVRGLYSFYEELALRFAERGYPAVAFDFYGRTAGVGKRGAEFDFGPHREQATDEGVQLDVGACIDWLRDHGVTRVFTVGFCFGGRHSWLAAAAHDLAGAVGFYGRPPVERAAEMRAPILALQAGADDHISAEDNAAFDAALTVEHEVVTFPGAPHSFFDRKQEDYADASADAWRRVLAFVEAR